jgi:cytochrome c oxidase subunit II
MIDLLVERASSFAGAVDGLFLLILLFVGFWFIVAEVLLFWLIFRFKAKPGTKSQYITGKEKHLKRWVTIPHVIIIGLDLIIVAASFVVWNQIKIDMPDGESTIRVIGQQWAWIFQHPGPDNVLDTPDDILTVDHLYVQNGRIYNFQLESRDVLHSFSVPVFRLKQDAIPGRRILGWFQPTLAGSYDIQCAEICGIGHGVMFAQIHVQDEADHAAWVVANAPATGVSSPVTPAPPPVVSPASAPLDAPDPAAGRLAGVTP